MTHLGLKCHRGHSDGRVLDTVGVFGVGVSECDVHDGSQGGGPLCGDATVGVGD